MIIKGVPFISNHSDNLRCFQACIWMVLKYFNPKKDYSWKYLDSLTDRQPDKGTWASRTILNLIRMNYQVELIENFDYQEFSKDAIKYLGQRYGSKIAKIQKELSDLPKEMDNAKELSKIFKKTNNIAEIKDIKNYLKQGYLVIVNLNYFGLYQKPGYMGHFVLIYGYDSDSLYLHDPGLPPKMTQKVNFDSFTTAWAYPNKSAQNLIAIKKSSLHSDHTSPDI